MSESTTNTIWHRVQVLLRAIGLGVKSGHATSTSSADTSAQPLSPAPSFKVSIKVGHLPEPPDGGTPAVVAVLAPQTHARSRILERPLAQQLAYTASKNVPKGRKAACTANGPAKSTARPAAALPRKASVIKAKPVVAITTKKRAAKRRHVWLSNQARVIRPVVATNNVVQLTLAPRAQRSAVRPAAQKSSGRSLRLVA